MKEKKKYLMFNCFKGYECFDFTTWNHHCYYLESGEESSVDYKIIAFTCFYLRFEIMLAYNHLGRRWI